MIGTYFCNGKKSRLIGCNRMMACDCCCDDDDDCDRDDDARDLKSLRSVYLLDNSRTVFLNGPITPRTTAVLNDLLIRLSNVDEPEKKPVKLFINSPGGSVRDGFSVIDTIGLIGSPVWTYCTCVAASFGAMLLMSGAKGKRFVYPHSRVMLHELSGGLSVSKFSDAENWYESFKKDYEEIVDFMASKTGRTLEEIRKALQTENWMTAKEAIDFGIADAIAERPKT